MPASGHRRHQTEPACRSARAQRDETLRLEIQRVYDEHHQVYGPRKIWKQLRREGIRAARCTVGRLMRAMGLAGAVRGRAWVVTTHAGDGGRPADLVDRQFVATRPNQLWVSDFTYVATWSGFVYDVFEASEPTIMYGIAESSNAARMTTSASSAVNGVRGRGATRAAI